MKITIPVAVSIPVNNEGHCYELCITPDGVLGRLNTGARGRANRVAMYAEDRGHKEDVPSGMPILMRSGEVEVDADMLKEIVERGYAKTEEASIVNALKKAWVESHIVVQNNQSAQDWLDNTGWPGWPVEQVQVQVSEAPVTITAEVPLPARITEDVTTVQDSGDVLVEAITMHDNPAAYATAVPKEEWIPVKFNDHEIDSFEFLDRARGGDKKWNIRIVGPTGSGKSALCWAYAADRKVPIATVPFSEATDTTTIWDEVKLINGRSLNILTAAGMVAKYGGIIELQEPNSAGDGMMTAIYGPLSFEREITLSNGAKIPLHPDTLIVATQNPVDAAHTHASTMSAALQRRFWNVELGYMDEIEERLVPCQSLREIAQEIRRSDILQPFGTDSLVKAHHAITVFGLTQGIAGIVAGFENPADREIVKPILDVRLAELSTFYGEELASDVAEADLQFADLQF